MSFNPLPFLAGVAAARDKQLEAAKDAAGLFAEQVLADSQELVPVSPTDPKHPLYLGTSGALRDSGVVGEVEMGAGTITVELGYNTDYAAAVHEVLEANHQYPGAINPNAQAKYLSTPIAERADQFAPFVAEQMREAL